MGGFSVFPAEVEGFLMTHPAWLVPRSSACRTRAGARRCRRSSSPGPVARSSRPSCCASPARRIAGYKLPYDIEVVPELPLLASGKVDRAALRER